MNKTVNPLPRSVKVMLQGNEFVINFPNVGEMIDIETKKALYSANQYGAIKDSNTASSGLVLLYIDAIAHFTSLIPDLKELLKIESFFRLDLISMKEVTNQYVKVFRPWFNDWLTLIFEKEEDEVEKETPASDE